MNLHNHDSRWCHWGSFRWRAAWKGCSAEFCSFPAVPCPLSDPAVARLLPVEAKTHTHTGAHITRVVFLSLKVHKLDAGARYLSPLIICSCLRSWEFCLKAAASLSLRHKTCFWLHKAVVFVQRLSTVCVCFLSLHGTLPIIKSPTTKPFCRIQPAKLLWQMCARELGLYWRL